MNEQKIMIAIFVALGVMMVAGLIARPAAQAVSRSDLDKQIRDQVSKGTSGLKDRIISQVNEGVGGHRFPGG